MIISLTLDAASPVAATISSNDFPSSMSAAISSFLSSAVFLCGASRRRAAPWQRCAPGRLAQLLLVQGFQESRGDGDTPLVGPIMPGERLVEGKRGMAERLMCLPV